MDERTPPTGRVKALVTAGLVALTFAVFFQVRDHEFVNLDDRIYIVENRTLPLGLGAEGLWAAVTRPLEAYWIPVTALSLQLDYALFGLEPAGWLLENVALHALAAIVLFLALVRMTSAVGPSAFVAFVFAVHPLHVESVAWATERKDVLSVLLWMLALYGYARAAEGARRVAWELVTLVAFALSLLAKPGGVTFPFVLLLLDVWPLGRLSSLGDLRARVVEKLPLFAMVLLVAVTAVQTQSEFGGMSFGSDLPFSMRLLNALDSYGAYVRQTFWPTGLAVFYPYPDTPPVFGAVVGGVIVLGLSAYALVSFRVRPYVLVGWLWFLGTLVPTIGIVQAGMQARADRFVYVPLIGLSIAFAWLVRDLAGEGRRGSVAVAGAVAIALLASVAWVQVSHWRSTEALFQHAVDVTERNYFAHNRLAEEFIGRQELDRALRHYAEAARFQSGWSSPWLRSGEIHDFRGDLDAAVEAYQQGLAGEPFSEQHAQRLALLLSSDPSASYYDPNEAYALRRRIEASRGVSQP